MAIVRQVLLCPFRKNNRY